MPKPSSERWGVEILLGRVLVTTIETVIAVCRLRGWSMILPAMILQKPLEARDEQNHGRQNHGESKLNPKELAVRRQKLLPHLNVGHGRTRLVPFGEWS